MPLTPCLSASQSAPFFSSPPWQHLRGGLPLSNFWPVSWFYPPSCLLLHASTSFSSLSLPYCAAAAIPPPPLSPLVLHFPPLPSFSPRCICLLLAPSPPFFPYIRIIFTPSPLPPLSSSPPHFWGSSPHYITVLPTSILAASTLAHTHTPGYTPPHWSQSPWQPCWSESCSRGFPQWGHPPRLCVCAFIWVCVYACLWVCVYQCVCGLRVWRYIVWF